MIVYFLVDLISANNLMSRTNSVIIFYSDMLYLGILSNFLMTESDAKISTGIDTYTADEPGSK